MSGIIVYSKQYNIYIVAIICKVVVVLDLFISYIGIYVDENIYVIEHILWKTNWMSWLVIYEIDDVIDDYIAEDEDMFFEVDFIECARIHDMGVYELFVKVEDLYKNKNSLNILNVNYD